MKKIYFVRHAQATGQEPDARLTDEGTRQAEQLVDFMENVGVEYVQPVETGRANHSALG